MRTVTLLCAALLSSPLLAMDAKQACDELKPVFTELQAQTPIQVDYMTSLSGVQAYYVGGVCFVNYNYIVDAAAFATDMAKQNELSVEQNTNFLRTEQGAQVLQSTFNKLAEGAAKTHFAPMANIKDMRIHYNYNFDDLEIMPITTVVIDNT